jgi:AAA15 family ATPase/GTPase
MSNNTANSLFLKKVNLSGYKSIEDVSVDFYPGLNIIIGKNAAGKTNFLRFLNRCLSFDFEEFSNFSSKLTFQNGKSIEINSSINLKLDELISENRIKPKIDTTLLIEKKVVKDKKDRNNSIVNKLRDNDVFFNSTFLCHGTPKDYPIVEKPLSFKVESKNRLSVDLLNIMGNNSYSYFLKSLAIDILVASPSTGEKLFNPEITRKLLADVFQKVSNLKTILKTFSPIEDIRISDNFNLYVTDDGESYTVNNVFLEFKIEKDWLPFSSLSDGTRRIFYIISEVYDYEDDKKLRPVFGGGVSFNDKIPRIILIEEPELGLHPHQFRKLMSFLKEQSKFNQIILTTHSPQTLDVLGSDDLEKIVIAYSSEEGTKLKHLSDQELEKAKTYIDEEFLSDYWLYSDLEKRP